MISEVHIPARELAPAKLNLALHVRGKLPDGRHRIDTIFAFCTDGDRLSSEEAESISLVVTGPFAGDLDDPQHNLVMKAALTLAEASRTRKGAALTLDKQLPVASGIGGGSADAAAALRLLTSMWRIDPAHALAVAPQLGSDVPACLLSLPMRGEGAGDQLSAVHLPNASGSPVLLVNPGIALSTGQVFAKWNGIDSGPVGDWRKGRNDLEQPAVELVPEIASVLSFLSAQEGAIFVRMSGSGGTCFALFGSAEARDLAANCVPQEWWRLATFLR